MKATDSKSTAPGGCLAEGPLGGQKAKLLKQSKKARSETLVLYELEGSISLAASLQGARVPASRDAPVGCYNVAGRAGL